MKIKENLESRRIVSIDAFRGITILAMIFVNELAGVSGMPQWLRHMPGNVDGMTFVDLVFPAFLFIVGMSIPFALNARISRGQSNLKIWTHIIGRSLALIIMGLFMVNIESGYNARLMIIAPALWGFFAYFLPIPVWNSYAKDFPSWLKRVFQAIGVAGFIVLWILYIREDGSRGMTPQWWGILGLIGWAYLFTVIFYCLARGNLLAMIAFFVIAVTANSINQAGGNVLAKSAVFSFFAGHMVHVTLVIAGVIISLLFFDMKKKARVNYYVLLFIVVTFFAGHYLRPYFEVSKIRGTPSWTLFSASICAILYYILYLIMEERKLVSWSKPLLPAASNPLLIYILPGIIMYAGMVAGIKILPVWIREGIQGVAWSLIYTVIILFLVKMLTRFGIRLNL